MKRCSAALLVPLLLAAAPTPLVTGAVRDQFGDPVAGAVVSGTGGTTATDASGTFALEGAFGTVTIRCSYCDTTVARVGADNTVTAIVRRYGALTQETPSARDLAALPYANVESAIALRPYMLLNDSARMLPGPRISTYGTSPQGGLLVDNGIPDYDIAAGVTTWRTIPAYYAQTVQVRDQTQAFRYGDMAGGGTFFVNTQPQSQLLAIGGGGNQGEFVLAGTGRDSSYGFGAANDGVESRERADGTVRLSAGDDTLSVTGLLTRDDLATQYAGNVATDSQGLRVHYDRVRKNAFYADVVTDRSAYDSRSQPYSEVAGSWSDTGFQAGETWSGPLQFFTDFGFRESTGYYDASSLGIARVAGTVTQAHASLGADWKSSRSDVMAGLGAFAVSYGGGTLGTSHPLAAQILAPSLRASYAIAREWSVEASASDAFRLPTLLEAYTYPFEGDVLPFDLYRSITGSITYSDLHRLRASVLTMAEAVSNLDTGTVHSTGAALTWQVAPLLSLRAWAMHSNDTAVPDDPLARFGRPPMPATVSSYWLTYENPAGMRVDAIYRWDLTDYSPYPHFDASISGPVTPKLRWFAATELRHSVRYTNAGVRVTIP